MSEPCPACENLMAQLKKQGYAYINYGVIYSVWPVDFNTANPNPNQVLARLALLRDKTTIKLQEKP